MADAPDPFEPRPIEIENEPTVAGRLARWTERGRILQTRADAARARHASIDLGFSLVEHDSSIGGGLLAGALAYRLFVLLLPTSLLLVSGLGLYAGTVDKSPSTVAKEAGLHGLIASEVSQAASSRARGVVFLADDSGRALRAGDALPCDRKGARDRLARIGARRPDHAEGSRRVGGRAARPALHGRDRGLDPPRAPTRWSGSAARLRRGHRRRVARGLRCSCPIARFAGPRLSPARCCSASGRCSSMPSTSTSRPAWSRAEPTPTARSASRPPYSSRSCSWAG